LENRFLRLIEILTRHDVRFIVVGGVAVVLQRVPINTQDFDLVHDRVKDSVARLLLALCVLKEPMRTDLSRPSPCRAAVRAGWRLDSVRRLAVYLI
jgi:hypothetical protein